MSAPSPAFLGSSFLEEIFEETMVVQIMVPDFFFFLKSRSGNNASQKHCNSNGKTVKLYLIKTVIRQFGYMYDIMEEFVVPL